MRSAVLSVVSLTALAASPATARADASRDFESRVRPLLVAKCQECHGEKLAEAGLRLDSRRALLQGGEEGPVVVPGDAAKSRLIAAVRHVGGIDMPPTGKLSEEEIATLESWVAAGVPWTGPGGDDASPPPTRAQEMEQRIADARGSHWAFTPPSRHSAPDLPPSLPAGMRGDWEAAPIDRFIAARLAQANLAPAEPARPRDLVRRLFFDLTGLPPPAAECDAFCANPTEDAYRALVDRLLASREHAEHWARKWLDLARYADTMGYAFAGQSPLYPFAWTYRDWVVRALQADVPYDRFVTLQLAADLVSPPVPREDLAALGFLTVGRSFNGNIHDIIDDRIDLVTRGLMGLTASCARCHDHKYEPVSMADYYALHGIFSSCESPEELPTIGDPPAGPDAETFATKLEELRKAVAEQEAAVHVRVTRAAVAHAADYLVETARPAKPTGDGRPPKIADGYELQRQLIDRVKRGTDKAATHPILGPWTTLRGLTDAEIWPRLEKLLADWGEAPDPKTINPLVRSELASARPANLRQLADAYGRLVARVAPEWAGGTAAAADEPADLRELRTTLGGDDTLFVVPRGEVVRLASQPEATEHRKRKQAITKHFAQSPGGPPRAMVLVERAKPVDSHILLRGNPGKPGAKVERRLPQILGGAPADRATSGRLDLAHLVVDPANPLTPRVIVNWAWTHHFGRGLVETPGDLGIRGEPPSHPELLDDLARRFIDDGNYSLRWLHREIVTSRTWRQTSVAGAEHAAHDPDNRLFGLANRRRLDWEPWRDSLLAAAGSLDPASAGGGGVDPLDVSAMHKRSLYGSLDRQDVPGILRVFDFANPDTAVHVRSQTTVPQRSLAVLNSPLVVEAAKRVAARAAREAGEDADGRVVATWRAVLSRNPDDGERMLARGWLVAVGADAAPEGFGPYERLAHALLASAEFQFID